MTESDGAVKEQLIPERVPSDLVFGPVIWHTILKITSIPSKYIGRRQVFVSNMGEQFELYEITYRYLSYDHLADFLTKTFARQESRAE